MMLNTNWPPRADLSSPPFGAHVLRANEARLKKSDRLAAYGLMAIWLAGCGCSSPGRAEPGGAAGNGGATGGGETTGSGGAAGAGVAGSSGTAGSAGAGGSEEGGLGECPLDGPGDVVGWASVPDLGVTTTVGGAAGPTVSVSSIAELRTHVAGTAPKIIQVKGTLRGNLTIGSNKTIVGCGARIEGHIEMSGSVNVIFRNMTVVGYAVGDCALDPTYDPAVGCSSGFDAMTIQKNAHHVWVDHCDISDGTDGNLDITNGANYVTVSWTKFHYSPRTDDVGNDSTGAFGHRYANLVGSTDTPVTYDDANTLNVTWHHNWWTDNVSQRQPRVRFGKNHLFNNLWSSPTGSYCIRAGTSARILVESSVFSGVVNPQEFYEGSDQNASITAADNVYDNTTGTVANGGGGPAFTTPPYTYTPDATGTLQASIQSLSGPR
jgi:pectate lyase